MGLFVVYVIFSKAVMALLRFLHSSVFGSALDNFLRSAVSTSLRNTGSRCARFAMSCPRDAMGHTSWFTIGKCCGNCLRE